MLEVTESLQISANLNRRPGHDYMVPQGCSSESVPLRHDLSLGLAPAVSFRRHGTAESLGLRRLDVRLAAVLGRGVLRVGALEVAVCGGHESS
ncbi:hypothetical protein FRIGORI9N_420132 [Frigoribacterium sp. 9N]|nr:hypothetical protein FRIGORI9N_420132 [Frigoribacterium sp. 9N]